VSVPLVWCNRICQLLYDVWQAVLWFVDHPPATLELLPSRLLVMMLIHSNPRTSFLVTSA
jgi:hypothetical protein